MLTKQAKFHVNSIPIFTPQPLRAVRVLLSSMIGTLVRGLSVQHHGVTLI